MTNLMLQTSKLDDRIFYQGNLIRQGQELIEFVEAFLCSEKYPIFIANSSLTESELLSALRASTLGLTESSDGNYSIVRDQESHLDFSQKGGFFDLHQDGLGHHNVPDVGILFCVNPGKGTNPTIFCDTLEIIRRLTEDEHTLETMNGLQFVYIDKSGREQIHPFLAMHDLTGEPFLYLGSRGYLRQRSVDQAPSIRDISNLLNRIFELADNATFLEHYWQKGNLIIWDNHRLLHGRGCQTRDRDRRLIRFLLNH
jgi:alpha-ketoglutarate-dependent taurine dioxygenase